VPSPRAGPLSTLRSPSSGSTETIDAEPVSRTSSSPRVGSKAIALGAISGVPASEDGSEIMRRVPPASIASTAGPSTLASRTTS